MVETDSVKLDSILNGVEHETRDFYITTGLSEKCKYVMYVLYSFPKPKYTTHHNSCGVYLGNLSNDYETAIINARKRLPHFKIGVEAPEELNNRRIPSTIPFGKYGGETIEDVFDKDPKYIFWMANNVYKLKSLVLAEKLSYYAKFAKEIIISENVEKSNEFLPLETKNSLKKLKIYGSGENEYGYKTKLVDINGNKFLYSGKFLGKKDEEIEIKVKIKKHVTLLGVNFNILKFR